MHRNYSTTSKGDGVHNLTAPVRKHRVLQAFDADISLDVAWTVSSGADWRWRCHYQGWSVPDLVHHPPPSIAVRPTLVGR